MQNQPTGGSSQEPQNPTPYQPGTPCYALERLAREIPSLTPDGNKEGVYLYEAEGEPPVTLSVCGKDARRAEIEDYADKKEKPSVVTGVAGDTAYTAVLNETNIYVYVTARSCAA